MNETKTNKKCSTCGHDYHRPGDCDHDNCGESELVYSRNYVAMNGWWIAGSGSEPKVAPSN